MSQMIEVKVPDIGDFDAVPIIELFVKVGDSINVDDAICTLESDKATMDVPSAAAGVVREVLVGLGDKVGEGAGFGQDTNEVTLIRRTGDGSLTTDPWPAATKQVLAEKLALTIAEALG